MKRRGEQDKKRFNYRITINELDSNTRMSLWYTQKAAELWDHLARRGFVTLIEGLGYFYRFEQLQAGLKKLWEEGLTKKGGYFYQKRYYF